MTGRRLRILLGTLGVLVVAYLVVRFAVGRGGAPPSEPLALASAAELTIDSLVVVSEEDTVRLVRAGDGWTVNGLEAVADAGTTLESALEDARVGALASRNPENHERLGVAEGQGHRASFYSDGQPRLEIVLGEAARAAGGRYVRRAGEDEVHVLQGNLADLVRRGVEEWREKEILPAHTDSIARIEYAYPDTSFAVARDTAGWRLEPGSVTARSEEVAGILGQLAGLRALGFADDTVTVGLDWESPTARLRVLRTDGTELGTVMFLEREEPGYFVRRADKPTVYTVSRFAGERILRRPDGLVSTGEGEGSGSG